MSQPQRPLPALRDRPEERGAGAGGRSALLVAGVTGAAAGAVVLGLLTAGGQGADGAERAPAGATAQRPPSAGEPVPGAGSSGPAGSLPGPGSAPEGLGADPVLDVLARACAEGDMPACDELYDRSDAGSDYETYGDTCAGRQPVGTFDLCTETFPSG